MALIHLVPVGEGMMREELAQRIQSGWVLAGRQAINLRSAIIDPTKPMTPTGVTDVDVWVLPEATIPSGLVAHTLVEAYTAAPDREEKVLLLDDLARKIFGAGILILVEQVAAAASAAEAKQETTDGNQEE